MINPDVSDSLVSGSNAGGGVGRLVVVSAVVGTLALAVGAFWLSFTTLRDLAVMAGILPGQAWIWPLIVDGVILQATISIVALGSAPARARRFAWLLLAAGAGVSVAANVTHAVVTSPSELPSVVAAVIASVPPLVLLAMTHLTVELTRHPTTQPPSHEEDLSSTSTPEIVLSPQFPELQLALEAPEVKRPVRESGGGSSRLLAARLADEGLSRREIAEKVGVHPTTVGRWLTPKPMTTQEGLSPEEVFEE